jgi:hypothetical protein
MRLFDNGKVIATYTISTAKRGIGDLPDSYMTPGGKMEIAEKFGAGMPVGTAFKDRVPTGEIVAIDAPGRDPVVTRILWLRGTEERNQHAYQRYIYIHGTPQESLLGNPASYGCIRMRSADIVELFDKVGIGAEVFVAETELDLVAKISTDAECASAWKSGAKEAENVDFHASGRINILGEYFLKPFIYKDIKAKSPDTPRKVLILELFSRFFKADIGCVG